MPKKQNNRKYNLENRHCNDCGKLHSKGELTYYRFKPGKGRGHWFICRPCDAAEAAKKAAIERNMQIKKEREELKASQPTLF